MENRKGVLGLETVKLVMITFLVIGVVAVATIITLVNVRDVAEDIDRTTVIMTNLTIPDTMSTNATAVGGLPIYGTANLKNCIASITSAVNESATLDPIGAGNWTITNCTVAMYLDDENFNNSEWNVSGHYIYSERRAESIAGNISAAETGFFSNTNTIFAILIVVVIILAIAIIIAVVSRFGAGRVGGGIGGRAGGRSREPDTVMGI